MHYCLWLMCSYCGVGLVRLAPASCPCRLAGGPQSLVFPCAFMVVICFVVGHYTPFQDTLWPSSLVTTGLARNVPCNPTLVCLVSPSCATGCAHLEPIACMGHPCQYNVRGLCYCIMCSVCMYICTYICKYHWARHLAVDSCWSMLMHACRTCVRSRLVTSLYRKHPHPVWSEW